MKWYIIIGGILSGVLIGLNALFGDIVYIFHPTKFNAFNDVSFQLFTKSNRVNGSSLVLANFNETLSGSSFNQENPTRVIIHGWLSDGSSLVNQLIRNAFFNRSEDFNVIVVDWGKVAKNIDYIEASVHVHEVGKVVAKFLENLLDFGQIDPLNVTLIGHSLGAQVAGYAGRNLRKPLVLGTIVALDPANPLFGPTRFNLKPLATSDANYVQSIQTCRGVLGEFLPLGHASFYPNYGPVQPGCFDPTGTCSHERSFRFYAESITTGNPFVARKCEDYFDDIALYRCRSSGPNATMGGEPLDKSASGVYWLSTNKHSPFSKGSNGVE